MDETKQKYKIAEACGFKRHGNGEHWAEVGGQICGYVNGEIRIIPDYLNNLDAMHEAELILSQDYKAYGRYGDFLLDESTQAASHRDIGGVIMPTRVLWYSQTSKQRAKAFLKALNLWEN